MPVRQHELADLKHADIDVTEQKLAQTRILFHIPQYFGSRDEVAAPGHAHHGLIRRGFCAQQCGPAGNPLAPDKHGLDTLAALIMHDGRCEPGFDETEMGDRHAGTDELVPGRQVYRFHTGGELRQPFRAEGFQQSVIENKI